MSKIDALQEIKELWGSETLSLGEKIIRISSEFSSAGLDLASTAAFIKATPSELDSFLSLGYFDDNIIQQISKVNPPKTTWTMLANASEDEVLQALNALEHSEKTEFKNNSHYTASQFVYQKMVEMSGPTITQRVAGLSGAEISHMLKKAEDFGKVNDWEIKFLKSISVQKKRGRTLTDKQVELLVKILNHLVINGVIKRNSIDGDVEICDRVLDALGV